MKCDDHCLACSSPSLAVSSLASVSSHLLPTNISGTFSNEPCDRRRHHINNNLLYLYNERRWFAIENIRTKGKRNSVVVNVLVYMFASVRPACRTYFDFSYDFPCGFELLKRLPRRDGVDHDKGVPFGDVEPLHGRELVGSCRVCDLKGADGILVARYHLSVAFIRNEIHILSNIEWNKPHRIRIA